jgi:uncharacterized membrane protein
MKTSARVQRPDDASRSFRYGSILLGIALSGFFDGILLHQVLQWHHLLSGIDDPLLAPIEHQVLADGLFHVLMYGIAAGAICLLWRGRAMLTLPLANTLSVYVLGGFGVWNVFDVTVFHWLAGLHRVRMDSSQPMVWDLAWLLAFGLAPMALAFQLFQRRRPRTLQDAARSRSGLLAWAAVTTAVLALGFWSSRPPADSSTLLVLYPPGTSGVIVMQGADEAGARIMWVNASGTLWAFDVSPTGETSALYRHGALLTSRAVAWSACGPWLRPAGKGIAEQTPARNQATRLPATPSGT